MPGKNIKVAIGADFLDAFSEIPKGKQSKVRQFVEKFRAEPTGSGINYEKINGAKDSNLRSVRIDQAYRGIVLAPETGNVYVLLWVAHHDDAYAWAENKVFKVHPETGSLQFFDVNEAEAAHETQQEPEEEGLFTEFRDRELTQFGVPEELLPLVYSCKTEGDLDAIQPHLPDEAYEALFLLAAGATLREVDRELEYMRAERGADTDDFAAALENPDTQRRFHIVDDELELQEILNAPLEKWRVFLHPSQRKLVEMNANGPVRVLGGAGTGKTVAAMHRAKWLAEHVVGEDEKLLFTTFTRNLAADIEENLGKICSEEALARIEVTNLDRWVFHFLKKHGYEYEIDYGDRTEDLWESALGLAPDDLDLPAEFYREEWEEVIQPHGITSLQEYSRIFRQGRGTPLRRADRKAAWPVFEEYQTLLNERRLREPVGAMRDARNLLEEKGDILPYRCIVVDEAQDMGMQAFKLLRRMVPEQSHDLFIVGDGHQSIYRRPVVLSHCGINIVGRGRRLRINYRTTEENRKWAVGILDGVTISDLDGGVDSQEGYKSLMHGAHPEVHPFDSFQDEIGFIVSYLNDLEEERRKEVCLVARTHNLLDQYEGALRANGFDTYHIRRSEAENRNAPGVRLATMHRVKGIEFERVIIAGVNDGIVPLSVVVAAGSNDVERENREIQERSLLYVAATRAKREVIVTSFGEPSRFL